MRTFNDTLQLVRETKGVNVHGMAIEGRFMHNYKSYYVGTCRITNPEGVDELIKKTQDLMVKVGKVYSDEQREVIAKNVRVNKELKAKALKEKAKLSAKLSNPKKFKANTKLVKATKGLRLTNNGSRVHCDITINKQLVYLGSCMIGETEKIENLMVMVLTAKDYLRQPVTIGKIHNQFKTVPTASNFMVSKKGIVIFKDTQYKVKQFNIKGYNRVSVVFDNGVKWSIAVHQLVAMTYLGYKRPSTLPNWTGEVVSDTLVVDHINNNTLDNRLSNLQIITSSENLTKGLNEYHKKSA